MFCLLGDENRSNLPTVWRDSVGGTAGYQGNDTGPVYAADRIAAFTNAGDTVTAVYGGAYGNKRTISGWGLAYVAVTATGSSPSLNRFDWVRVRKYAATLPTLGTPGSEEVASSDKPVVSNSMGATNVWAESAWLNGTLVSTGTSDTVWGVLWGTNNPGKTTGNWLGGNSADLGVAGGTNLFNTTHATDLTPNTTYYYAYWATNAAGTNVAAATAFTTKGPATVDNGSGASDIGVGAATLNGYLSATGGVPTDVFIYWGADTNNWSNTNAFGSRDIGAFSVPVSNLYYGVRYWYRCFAANACGGAWATEATSFLSLFPSSDMPSSGMTRHYAFDDAAAPYADTSPSNVTGTAAHGAARTTAYKKFGAGALDLTAGKDAYLQPYLAGGTGPAFANTGWTITAWFLGIRDTTQWRTLCRGNENHPVIVQNGSYSLGYYNSSGGSGGLYPGNPAMTTYSIPSAWTDDLTTWHFLAAVYDGTKIDYFVDGAASPVGTLTGTTGGPWYLAAIGAYQGGGQGFSKYLDDVYTFNRALTTAELGMIYANSAPAMLTVTNTGSSAAAPGAATFTANVQATGSVFEVWVYWGPTDGTNNPTAWLGSTLATTVTNAVSADVSKTVAGLAPGTTFYTYRIINAATNYWASPSGSAIVEATADAPKIETRPATNVHTNRATLNGMLISTGTSATVVSVYWGSDGDQVLSGAWAHTNDFGVCTDLPYEGLAYATNVTGLIPGQEYTYRYYAANATTGVWGDAVSFVTWLTPTVDNGGGAMAVGQTTATLNGTVLTGNPNPQAWIYWGTTDGGTDKGAWNRTTLDRGVQAGSFSGNVSGLEANRTYYYRCYVSNACGEAWAPASASFTTLAPGVSISDAGVTEGASSTTTSMVFTVSLSAVSALDATIHFATANGTATTADNDYMAIADTLLTIPAGNLTGQITVTVNGNDLFEANETLTVNLSSLGNVTNIDSQGLGTINNDDWTVYVRGDGQGSDGYSGTSWPTAWATLQKALNAVQGSKPLLVNVQASTGSQAYAPCQRQFGDYPTTVPCNVTFQGGWENVDAMPTQTGMTAVKSANTNQHGIYLMTGWHDSTLILTANRFAFSDVISGIFLYSESGTDGSHCIMTVSNCTVRALNNGLTIYYPKPYPYPGAGGQALVLAENIDVVAGLGGSGNGVNINGWWDGSRITASGMDPVTGQARVSTITAPNGTGVYFSAINLSTPRATFARTVIHSCAGDAIRLEAPQISFQNTIGSNRVYAALSNCTLVDNGADGLHLISQTPGGWGNPTNSIFANNGGSGINLDGGAGVFTCSEGYNVFFNNGNTGIQVNGTPQSPAGSTSTADPLFRASGAKPAPWYWIGSRSSPAYKTASDNGIRGAYQNDPPPSGTVILIL
jgi:hypothetical protein